MSQNKLHIYIASTLLVNVLIGAELLPPAQAKSDKTTNSVDKLALNTSSPADADAFRFTSQNLGLSTTTTTNIFQKASIQHFDTTLTEKNIEVLSADGLDLDSILDREFDRREFLISRCCF
jgi:hypothetical protein